MKQAEPFQIKVGSFNLFNLALPNEKYYNRTYTSKDFEQKSAWISQQLGRMDADIVGFQEVFHKKALEEVVHNSPKLSQAQVVMSERVGGSPAVALASTYPIESQRVIVDFPEVVEIEGALMPIKSFSRPVLEVKLMVNGQRLTVVVAHLKSKRPMFAEGVDREDPLEKAKGEARSLIRRVSEATALRSILLETLANRDEPLILLGDLNDNDLAVSTQIISGSAPFRRWPHAVKKKLWDVLLYHVKAIQARRSYQDFYYSHIHNGHYEALDHIMVSQELVGENPHHIGKVGYVQIFNDHLIDDTISDQKVPFWQSDHAQVVASLELK